MFKIKYSICFFIAAIFSNQIRAQNKLVFLIDDSKPGVNSSYFQKPNNKFIQYTGRIERSNPILPRFWSSGVYIKAKFKGNICKIFLNDEVLYGNNHNYVEIIIDNYKPERLQTKGKTNAITVHGLNKGLHTITICKDTESGNGYLEFAGLSCESLFELTPKPNRKIEFIGNSITCGSGSDISKIACETGQWYDQHNAYMSYGPLTSRALQAQWQLSSVSGIGLMHSCCNMNIIMPQVFDKINMRENSISWDFNQYIPDIVTICLGQNDGIQDSVTFCNAYINFIKVLRSKYAKADIILLTSPMGDDQLTAVLKNYLASIVTFIKKAGDKHITKYFFNKRYRKGCGGHPSLDEHRQISAELVRFVRQMKNW